ncbi:MAG TPA: glycosyltransferase [Acidimicrobiales bacterium]|nr:glycosyltransferase [Acidimicrobiales bacterium]
MTTVALVPAKDRADTVAATVAALGAVPGVDEVVVVDDGSADGTAEAAAAAGARVVRLARNRGKGGAIAAGAAAAPDAAVYLLIDADLGTTAGLAEALLAPVAAGEADMTVGALPSAGRRGGFGNVRRLAAVGILRATGFEARAPLSGQRAVRGELLRSLLPPADRFGLEVGLTIDALRSGARVVEIDVAMDHRHTGRRLSGFRHRASQGLDILRALWPRLTSPRLRVGLIAAAFLLASMGALVSGSRSEPASVPSSVAAGDVVIFGMPRLAWEDIGTGRLPNLDRLAAEGAMSATSVRTLSGRPSTTEGYATLGAGTRVAAEDVGGFAFDAESVLEGGSAAQALQRRSGRPAEGEVAVVGGPATRKLNAGRHLTSSPGALADALHRAGKRTAVIGNADTGYPMGERASLLRPAAIALMDSTGSVDVGAVSRDLLQPDPAAPFGYTANDRTMMAEFDRALDTADVVLVDPGELDRAAEFTQVASAAVADEVRTRALRETDDLLGEVAARLPGDALLLVVSVVPPAQEWHLTPTLLHGRGVPHGYLHSPSTRRAGVITLTDLAPTVLAALDVPEPSGMIGHPLRFRPGSVDVDRFRTLDRDAAYREGIYLPLTLAYITLQALLYLVAIVAFARLGGVGRAGRALRAAALGIAAYPLATFVFRAIPDVAALGGLGVVVLVGIVVAIVALATRARRHPFSPLAWILGATVALLALDVATGARLQSSSLLGYSLHTAARFTGLGNTAFATLAATTVLLGAIHVAFAPRRREAVVAVACLFAFVVVIDGAPSLGSDVGGILTLVPVFGLTLLVLSGRRVSARALVVAGAVTLVALALATGIDLLRPASTRTHLGRLVADIGDDGLAALTTTVERKLAVNFRTYRSPWSWTVVIIALYMLYVLGWARGWRNLLPPRSALRAGVVGTLAAGLVGYAVNDSGVVVTAVVFVYLGPFLTLLALEREHHGEEPAVR